MELTRENVAALIGAVVAVLLQIMVAPAIALFSAIPNFIVAFCVVRAVAAPYQAGSLIPLALGLVFDLVGGGPVGGMAFVLVLVTFFASRLFAALNSLIHARDHHSCVHHARGSALRPGGGGMRCGCFLWRGAPVPGAALHAL